MGNNTVGSACNIATGKLDANQAVAGGGFPFFTCAKFPDTIDSFAFDDDVVLIAGNNAKGNFHVSRYSGKFNAYQRTYVLTTKDGADIDYIYYALKLELRRLREKSQGSQTKFLTMPILISIGLNNIGHDEQVAISKILAKLDKKIELNNKVNVELEAMAKFIYDYWFVQFDFPDANGKPYKSSGGKMVYNEALKREIPDGWVVGKLVEEMSVQYGFPFSTKLFNEGKVGFPVIRIRNILDNSISIHSSEKVDEKYLLEKGDLIIGMDGNFHLNFWDKDGCFLNQRCVRIRKKVDSLASHFQVLFEIEPYIKAREKNVSRTTVGHLSAKDINDLKILIPSSDKVINEGKIFDSILTKIVVNRNENQKLSKLRDWLLPMLMNGQVTVKDS
jgi:type I restriction enzyme S subunit